MSRRIDVPEMFPLADAIAITLQNVTEGLVVFPHKIHSNIMAELPFREHHHEADGDGRVQTGVSAAPLKTEG